MRRRDLDVKDLCRIDGEDQRSGLPPGGDVVFAVTTPEVRTRLRFSLIFVPFSFPAGSSGDLIDRFWPNPKPPGFTTFFATTALWLSKRDEPVNGSAENVPVQNLVGDIWTPTVLPDPGCLGFTREFETCNDEVYGRFHVDSTLFDGFSGKWVLRVSAAAYQGMTEDEWNRVMGRVAIRLIKTGNFGGPVPT